MTKETQEYSDNFNKITSLMKDYGVAPEKTYTQISTLNENISPDDSFDDVHKKIKDFGIELAILHAKAKNPNFTTEAARKMLEGYIFGIGEISERYVGSILSNIASHADELETMSEVKKLSLADLAEDAEDIAKDLNLPADTPLDELKSRLIAKAEENLPKETLVVSLKNAISQCISRQEEVPTPSVATKSVETDGPVASTSKVASK